ncbi:hypothetical protein BGZ81_005758 [Podila clonocystis]|nr:hypothetical protein BGZ81_005758 [Podila clonocystis]
MSSKRIVTGDTIYACQLFTRQELVGRGAYGSVYKGVENATQQVVAIKVLNLDTEEEDVSDIQREIATLSQLKNCDSQNITRYHGSFLNGTKLWIVMDYAAGGSIRSLLRMGKIEEKCIAVIAREVLQALGYLHKHGIIHRDIKAANILLTDEGRVQLCDFGVAGQVTMNSLKRNSFVGTPYWMAPEVIKEGQTYDYKADIWSFGITIYEIATGNPPFADQDPMRAVTLIPKSRPAQLEGDWSPAMKEFVALCLHEEPNERPSAEDLLKTKWIKSTNKNSVVLLKDLVARYELFKRDSSVHKEENSEIDVDHELENFDMEVDPDAWRFDTAKTLPTMTPSRASSISRPSLDSKNECRSPILSTQDSGVVLQGRSQSQAKSTTPSTSTCTSPTVKGKAVIPTSPSNSSAQVKQMISQQQQLQQQQKPPQAPISQESHPLLRLFMNHKSASEDDVSSPHPPPQSLQLVSAPISLTIPNIEEITNARLASRSPVPNSDSSLGQSPQIQPHQSHHPTGGRYPEASSRIPFGFNMTKPFRFDRRPSAPVLMGSSPGPDYPFHNHAMPRGGATGSPLTSPRAVAPQSSTSILSNLHLKQDSHDPDGPNPTIPGKPNSHEIILPNQLQGVQQQNSRPSSTPASPAIQSTATMGSGQLNGVNGSNVSGLARDLARLNGPRRPSPTIPATATLPSLQQQQPQMQPQPQQQPQQVYQSRQLQQQDTRNNLPPSIPHRKASLDFSQTERYSHLRPSLPMRPPSAAAMRSSTFHGTDTVYNENHAFSNGITSGLGALSLQPINVSEEKLPPFGHSAAHLRMINVMPDGQTSSYGGHHRGSITSERDGLSPASSIHSDQTFGQMSSGSGANHVPSSASSTSSVTSASMPNSASSTGPSPSVVLARPGLRTVGSSENFARRIRSASMLRRTDDQDGTKASFQASRPPQGGTPHGGHQQASQSFSQHQQQQQQQQSQYSYGSHEPSPTDISRYRRASSPRRRSISMTNLNGDLSVIMIPPKKTSVDDYAPNPLLLPPSPSTTRFIAPSSLNVSTLSSSPLRPALHSMTSSSSLSSSFGSVSEPMGSHANGSSSNLARHLGSISAQGSSIPSLPNAASISPSSHPQATNPYSHGYKSMLNNTSPSPYQNHHYHSPYGSHHANNTPSPHMANGSSVNGSAMNHNHNNLHPLHPHHPDNQPHHHHLNGQNSSTGNNMMIPLHLLMITPEARPLQMDALRRNDDLLEELQLTVNDLSQWLEVFETGIKSVRSS